MKKLLIIAALLFSSPAVAQWQVPDHSIPIGRGAGTGFKSMLCTSAQLVVGQSAADPICRTITGGITIDAAGVTTLGITPSSCTNQFVTGISSLGIGTCTTDTLASAQHANQGTTTTLLHGNAAGNPAFGAVVSADLNITTTTCTNQHLSAISATGTGTCTTDVLASAQHANQGTTTTVLHGAAAGNPAFGAVVLTTDVSGTLPVANGGTGDTGTAWSAFTPALSCGTATFTVNSARSKTMGKTTWMNIDFTITAIGTCAGIPSSTLTFTLPNTSQAGGGFAGREMVSTGYGVNCGFSGSTATATCSPANIAGVAFAVNNRITLGGVYENQ